jgi:hypothetical protein
MTGSGAAVPDNLCGETRIMDGKRQALAALEEPPERCLARCRAELRLGRAAGIARLPAEIPRVAATLRPNLSTCVQN